MAPLGTRVTDDESGVEMSVYEQSVDFTEVEFIEVQNPDTCASFRSVMESEAELDHVAFEIEDVEIEVEEKSSARGEDVSSLWILGLCTISYLHCCSTGFSIPALLPSIAADSALTDSQGAFLTVGFTMVFALGQIPFGFLADRMERPKLLSTGIVIWSLVTSLASKATSFSDLMLIRFSTAAAQSMQNPISFGLIPELFPKKRTTAMAMYNCALYIGRALSFFFAIILAKFGVEGMMGIHHVPLDQFDVSTMSLLYITGDQATVAPLFDYQPVLIGQASSWRDLLFWIGIPGLGIASLLAIVPDPRQAQPISTEAVMDPAPTASVSPEAQPHDRMKLVSTIRTILQSRSFQATTLAASLNDIGFWSLISWQAIFYERIYEIPSSVYAPLLAAIIPISGIIGGVGGGLVADWLSQRNARYLLTFGATLLGSPLIFMSFQAGDYQTSFVFLLFGYCFLECYRASGAIMVRESSPANAVSTGAAVHLFVRNLFASIGPILIAILEPRIGLRGAMCIVPWSYLASAFTFAVAEKLIADERLEMQADGIS